MKNKILVLLAVLGMGITVAPVLAYAGANIPVPNTAKETNVIEQKVQESVEESVPTINQTEITLYGLQNAVSGNVSIPQDCPRSFQIQVDGASDIRYSIAAGSSAEVSDTGLITPKMVTYYCITTGKTSFCVKDPSPYPESLGYKVESTYKECEFGDSVIKVTADSSVFKVKVKVENYSHIYTQNIIEDAAASIFKEGMTNLEKVEAIGKYIAETYDYDASHSSWSSMALYGGGDCLASTSMACKLAEMAGLTSWSRNGSRDGFSGSNHHNAMIDLGDGTYAELEAGYVGDKPRSYDIMVKDALFSVRPMAPGDSGYTVYQYDGKDSGQGTLEIPETMTVDNITHNVTSIELNFSKTGVNTFEKVVLPDTIEKIGQLSFSRYFKCREINIPASVTNIMPTAFRSCTKLKEISCSEDNPCYSAKDGIIYDKDKTCIKFAPAPAVSEADIPSTVQTIDSDAFAYNTMTSFEIPDSVTTIGDYAFDTCYNLKKITIPDSVTSIGKGAFDSCTRLNTITIPSSVTSIGEKAFNGSKVTICGEKGSYAETYAAANNIPFVTADQIVKPTKISLSETEVSLRKNQWFTLKADVEPEQAASDVIWSSSDDSVAEIDQNGTVSTISEGTVMITCASSEDSSVKAFCKVIIPEPVPVTSITMAKSEYSLKVGERMPVWCTVMPENATYKDVDWTISDPTVADFTSYYNANVEGRVLTAYTSGTVVVTCTSKDGSGIKASCTLRVYEPVTEISLTPKELTMKTGESYQLEATVLPLYAEDRTVTYETSNDEIARVDENGKVTAVSPGSATIRCSANDGISVDGRWVYDTCKVEIEGPLTEKPAIQTPGGEEPIKKPTQTPGDGEEPTKGPTQAPGEKEEPTKEPTQTPGEEEEPTKEPTQTPGEEEEPTAGPIRVPTEPEVTIEAPDQSDIPQEIHNKYNGTVKLPVGSKITQIITGVKTGVIYKSSNPRVARVGRTNGVITCVGVGKAVITADVMKSSIYQAASKRLTICGIPRSVEVKSVQSRKKGQVILKSGNTAKGNDGYQIQYKHNGKTRIVLVKSKKVITKTFKKLKSGKNFKVRMRAYKKVSGVVYYGNYGKWKTLKRVK